MLNGILFDDQMHDRLLNRLSIARWRLRTHVHEDPTKCVQCIQDLIMLGQFSNSLLDYIDDLKIKNAKYRKAARYGKPIDLSIDLEA